MNKAIESRGLRFQYTEAVLTRIASSLDGFFLSGLIGFCRMVPREICPGQRRVVTR